MTTSDSQPSAYTEVRLTVPASALDPLCDYIVDNIAPGLILEQEDGEPEATVVFFVRPDAFPACEPKLRRFVQRIVADAADLQLTTRPVAAIEWIEAYQQSVKPVRVGDDIVVRPHWSTPLSDCRFDIVLEPKMAFGTGSHETTRGCLLAIRKTMQPSHSFLDIGCGSGILSILAAKMGASRITAIDYDHEAIDNTIENFRINGVTCPQRISHGSIEVCNGDIPYDIVCANIIKSTILEMLPRLIALTRLGGTLILSGLLTEDHYDMSSALAAQQQPGFDIFREGDWLTFTVRRH